MELAKNSNKWAAAPNVFTARCNGRVFAWGKRTKDGCSCATESTQRFHATLEVQNGGSRAGETVNGGSKRTRGVGKFMMAKTIIHVDSDDDDNNNNDHFVVEAPRTREQDDGAKKTSAQRATSTATTTVATVLEP